MAQNHSSPERPCKELKGTQHMELLASPCPARAASAFWPEFPTPAIFPKPHLPGVSLEGSTRLGRFPQVWEALPGEAETVGKTGGRGGGL